MTRWYGWLCSAMILLTLAASCPAQDNAEYTRWLDEMNRLEASSDELLRSGGREAFIRRYREFIDAHPGFDRNVYLEMRIAQSYEWDIAEFNQPHDYVQAAETYLSITRRYDPSLPEMAKIKLFAADRLADAKPQESAELYRSIIKDYPADDLVRLQCYWALGNNALKRGDKADAEQFFSLVTMYDETALPSPEAMNAAQVQKQNAAVGLVTLAECPGESAVIQLAALNGMLRKHPAISFLRPDMVMERLTALQRQAKREEAEAAGKAISRMEEGVSSSVTVPATPVGTQDGPSQYEGSQTAKAQGVLAMPWIGLAGAAVLLITGIVVWKAKRPRQYP